MMLEEFWREKSDREVELATRQIIEYTEEAQQIIRAEAKKRGIAESLSFEKPVVQRDPNLLGHLLEKLRFDGLDFNASNNFLRRILRILGGIAGLTYLSFFAAIMFASGYFKPFLAFAIVVTLLHATYRAIEYRDCYLLLYEQGVVYEKRGQKRIAYYDELEIWQKVTQRYMLGFIPVGKPSEEYTLRFPDGATVETFQGSIGQKLQTMVVQYQLPPILEAYNQGYTVQLGAVYFDKKGIIVHGVSSPWTDVSHIDVVKGVMYVYGPRVKFSAAQIYVSEIPNLYVLLSLLEQLGYYSPKEIAT